MCILGFQPHRNYCSYLTTETLDVEIAVENDDPHCFLVTGVTRHYRTTADGTARRKLSVNTNIQWSDKLAKNVIN